MIPDAPQPLPTPLMEARSETGRDEIEEKSAQGTVRKLAQALRDANQREVEATERVERAAELTPIDGFKVRSDSKVIRRLRALRDAT